MRNEEIMIFKNEEFGQVRTIELNGNVYFAANDVLKALGYAEGSWRTTLNRKCKNVTKCNELKVNGIEINLINESDLYRLIIGSTLPSAEKFESWVFDEVLPDIRKHGMYATENTIDKIISDPDFGIKLLTQLKEEKEEKERLKQQNKQILAITKEKDTIINSFIDDNSLYSVSTVAKVLAIKGLGRNNFWKYLRENKIIMSDVYRDHYGKEHSGIKHYEAYSQYCNAQEYFKHRIRNITIKYQNYPQSVAMFTAKGIKWIIKKLEKEGYIVNKKFEEIMQELSELKEVA